MTVDAKVDVIIPNYNETLLLSRAVDSVISQGKIVNRVIIVDDGSDEKTIQYLNSKFSGIDRIQVVHSIRHNHPGVMREIGINLSDSEWIAFLDADDFWEPDKLRKQLAFAIENKYQVVCSDANLYRNLEKIGRIYHFEVEPKISTWQLLQENIIINSSAVVRRECFQKIGGYPREFHHRGVEDYSLWLRLSTHFEIGFINEPLVNYEDQIDSLGKKQNVNLRNVAILDFIFWSKSRAPKLIKLYSKYYLLKVIGRA